MANVKAMAAALKSSLAMPSFTAAHFFELAHPSALPVLQVKVIRKQRKDPDRPYHRGRHLGQ
jgi:hypothetical protein